MTITVTDPDFNFSDLIGYHFVTIGNSVTILCVMVL